MNQIDERLLESLYEEGLSLNQIGRIFSVNANTVKYRLLKLGVRLRPKGRYKTYDFDEGFFAVPNELNSYWAGFIAADFSLCRQRGGRNFSELSCSLGIKDMSQLERFMNDIGHSSKVKVRTRTRKKKRLQVAEISITSCRMLNDLLANFNVCAGKKTDRLNPPIKLGRECRLPFIAGYVDGDGWLQYKRYLNMGVCGTHQMVSWIKDSMDKELAKVDTKGRTGTVIDRGNLSVWRANIHSWYLAKLLNEVPVVKMDRKLPQIYRYVKSHKERFRNKNIFNLLEIKHATCD